MNADQFANRVIAPTLTFLGPQYDSPAAVRLLLGTALTESGLDHLVQMNDGPARGVFQIEPDTLADLYTTFLSYRTPLRNHLDKLRGYALPPDQQLITNLGYATGVARLIYWRAPDPLPAADDIKGLAAYWKKHYNTSRGAGKVSDFVAKLEAALPAQQEDD